MQGAIDGWAHPSRMRPRHWKGDALGVTHDALGVRPSLTRWFSLLDAMRRLKKPFRARAYAPSAKSDHRAPHVRLTHVRGRVEKELSDQGVGPPIAHAGASKGTKSERWEGPPIAQCA